MKNQVWEVTKLILVNILKFRMFSIILNQKALYLFFFFPQEYLFEKIKYQILKFYLALFKSTKEEKKTVTACHKSLKLSFNCRLLICGKLTHNNYLWCLIILDSLCGGTTWHIFICDRVMKKGTYSWAKKNFSGYLGESLRVQKRHASQWKKYLHQYKMLRLQDEKIKKSNFLHQLSTFER